MTSFPKLYFTQFMQFAKFWFVLMNYDYLGIILY